MKQPIRLKSSKSKQRLMTKNSDNGSEEDIKNNKDKFDNFYRINTNEILLIFHLYEFEKMNKRPNNEIKIYYLIKKEWIEIFKDFYNCKKIYKKIQKNIKNDIFLNKIKSDNIPDELLKLKAMDEKIPKELFLFKEYEESTKNLKMENISLSYYPSKLFIIEEKMKNCFIIGNKSCNFQKGMQGILFKDTLYIIINERTLEIFIYDESDNFFDPVCLFCYQHKEDMFNDLNNKYKYKEIKQCLKELDFLQKKKPKYIRDDKKNVVGNIIYLLGDNSEENIINFLTENNKEIEKKNEEIKHMEEVIRVEREKEIKKIINENKKKEKEKKEERKKEKEERKAKELEEKKKREKERLETEELNKCKKIRIKLKRDKEREKEKKEEEIRRKEVEEMKEKERQKQERIYELQKENERLEKERIKKENEDISKMEKENLEKEIKENELKQSIKLEKEKELIEKIKEETQKLEEEKNRLEKERLKKIEDERIKKEKEIREKEEKERRRKEEIEKKKRMKKKEREDEKKRIREGFEKLSKLEEEEKKKRVEEVNRMKKEIKERRQKEKIDKKEKEKKYWEKIIEERKQKEKEKKKEEEIKKKEEEKRIKEENEKKDKIKIEEKIKIESKLKNEKEEIGKKKKIEEEKLNTKNKNLMEADSNKNPMKEEDSDLSKENEGDDREPKIGLENIGAAHYMNATLQCLCKTIKLTNYFIDPKNKDKIFRNNIVQKNKNYLELSTSYYDLIQHLWDKKNKRGFYSPNDFKNKICQMNSLFQGDSEGDSKDLISFILMKLHEELNEANNVKNHNNNINIDQFDRNKVINNFFEDFKKENNSIISDLFYGVIENISECINCKNRNKNQGLKSKYKYTFQSINFIIFPLEEVCKYRNNKFIQINANIMTPNMMTDILNNNRVFIMDCFEYYQNPVLMNGENKIYCNICKKKNDANYRTKIYYSPKTMILILDRGKNLQFKVGIDFLPSIDITKYIDKNYNSGLNAEYDLYAVLTHIENNKENGHYLAFCKSHDGAKKWYCYNDSKVTEIKDFIKQIHNYGMPYILFYERK